MKTLHVLSAFIVALFTQSCTTISTGISDPPDGQSAIKGTTHVQYAISAQYSYVFGYDKKITNYMGTGTIFVPAGKRTLAFGASHFAGIGSLVEMEVDLKPGKKYDVVATRDIQCTYTIRELPSKTVVAKKITDSIPSSELINKNYLLQKGWKIIKRENRRRL